MKFITERELRCAFNTAPFAVYLLEADTRLTPEARQFLIDRGIETIDTKTMNKQTSGAKTKICDNRHTKKLQLKMKVAASLFLLTGQRIIDRDIMLAQKIFELAEQFQLIQKMVDTEEKVENLICKECTGIKADTFSDDLGDCFEITSFHAQLEKGVEIVALHHLRCTLGELEPAIAEAFFNQKDGLDIEIMNKVRQIMNRLSQLICLCTGGKTCQR